MYDDGLVILSYFIYKTTYDINIYDIYIYKQEKEIDRREMKRRDIGSKQQSHERANNN